jgi:hypothetical protein
VHKERTVKPYDPKAAPRVVNEVVTAFVLRLVRTGPYESSFELERSYRERLRLLDGDEAYIESVMAFGRKAAKSIRAEAEPVN